jgi:hypothetical protein
MDPSTLNQKSPFPEGATAVQSRFFSFAVTLLLIIGIESSHGDTELVFDDETPSLLDGLQDGDSVTSGGITVTFSNVVVSDGGPTGDVEDTGILFSGIVDPTYTDVISVDLTFSHDVQISSYIIGGREDISVGRFVVLTGTNGMSAENTVPALSGSAFTEVLLPFDPGSIPVFKAGQPYTLSHNLPNDELSEELFNLEALFVRKVSPLTTKLVLTEGASGRVEFMADVGFRYSLRRLSILDQSSTEIGNLIGNGTEAFLSFDDSASDIDRAFFQVVREPIVRTAVAPAIFPAGSVAEVFFEDFSDEVLTMEAVSGDQIQIRFNGPEGDLLVLQGAEYVFENNDISGDVSLDVTLPQSTISDAQILAQLNAALSNPSSDLSVAVANLSDFPTEDDMEAVVDAVIEGFSGFFVDYDENNFFFIIREAELALDSTSQGSLTFGGPGLTLNNDNEVELVGVERSYSESVFARFR